jgi:hypothetical protein
MATMGLSLQIAFIYFFAAVLKSDPDWHGNGTAVFYALHLDKFATGMAVWIRQFPGFLRWITPAVWYFEFTAPLMLFVPLYFSYFRLGTTLALIGMHLGFEACLRIGTFPWICVAGLTALLPTFFWDRVSAWLAKLSPKTVVIEMLGQSVRDRIERWRAYRLGGAVRWVARFTDRLPRVPLLANLAAAIALFFAILWNIAGIPGTGISVPQKVANVVHFFGVDQHWGMFAPRPTRDDGWILVTGELESGKPVDVWYLDESPVNWAKPKRLLAYNYRSERWIKYFENLIMKEYSEERVNFANYLCRRWDWNFGATKRLKSLELFYMSDPTLPTGKGTPTAISLIKHVCPKQDGQSAS